jgi:GMC oxidoreductase
MKRSNAISNSDIKLRFAKWSPFEKRNFAKTLGMDALKDPQLTVFTHANAANLSLDSKDRGVVHAVQVLNYSGKSFTFTAQYVVLCAGTVECSRILLCSNAIPNEHDQIGRYFHDHVAYHAARLESPARERAIDLLGPFYVDGTIHSCKLEATKDLRDRQALHAVMAHIVIIEPEDSGAAAVRNLLRSLQSGQIKQAIRSNLVPMLMGSPDIFRLFYYSRFKRRRAISKRAVLKLNIDVEQGAYPDNRVCLSAINKDALGLPTAAIEWRIGEEEKLTAAKYAYVIKDFLEALGIAPLHWSESVVQHTTPSMLDTNHAMGGLRMGQNPASSVVDRDLSLHGLTNLFVASCAVFPSGSSSNPTFTLMALAMRLADNLVSRLGKVNV